MSKENNNNNNNNNVIEKNNDIIISCKINADSKLYKDFNKFLQENKHIKKSVFIRNALQNELNRYFKCVEERKKNNNFDVTDRFILNDFNNNISDGVIKNKNENERCSEQQEQKENIKIVKNEVLKNIDNLEDLKKYIIKRNAKTERRLKELENKIKLLQDCLF